METDRIIASLASEQHSVVTRPQLLDAGISRSAIDRRVAAGQLVSLYAGVYRPDGHPPSWRQSLMAAVLAGGSGAVVSHRGAACRLVTVEYMRRRLDAVGRQGRRGAGTLAELLADRSGGRPSATSVFERRLLATGTDEMIDAVRRGLQQKPRYAG